MIETAVVFGIIYRYSAYKIAMSSIQEEILQEFYRELAAADGFTQAKVDRIRDLFDDGKKPKAPDLISVLAEDPEEGLL